MKKLTTFLAIFVASIAFSQISVGSSVGNSGWTIGGYAGLGTGSGGTSLYITPRVGYKISQDFEMGMSGNLTWYNSSYYKSTMIGVGPFANYYIGRTAYVSGNFQEYFISYSGNTTDNSKKNESVLYLGGGYLQRLGENAYMQIGASYNVLYNKDKSVFGSGFVPQVGVVFGL